MERDFYNTYFEVEKSHWWFRVRRNIIFWIFSKYKIRKDAKVLDYGCGSGFLVGEFQEKGFDAFGVDIFKEAIEFGSGRRINNLSQESGVKVNFSDSYFDVILAMDVIEHIEDDKSAIKEIERLLKPGGYLIITVPAYQWMWGVQDEVAHHFRRYNVSSLLKIVDSSSFSVLKKSYFNTFLFFPIVAVRFVSKLFKIKERESDFDINGKLANFLFYLIFNLESKFLKFIDFPFGVSILIVLGKTDSGK